MSVPEIGLEGGARLVFTGGRPSDAEVAAVLLALDQARGQERAAAAAARPRHSWRRAARFEAVGNGRLLAAADLLGLRRS